VLGAGFEVHNYGVLGTTAINGSAGYANTAQYKAALTLVPDIVLLWFGGNDSFAGTWEQGKGQFKADHQHGKGVPGFAD
jgi:lysophospholipase L1-like esterase